MSCRSKSGKSRCSPLHGLVIVLSGTETPHTHTHTHTHTHKLAQAWGKKRGYHPFPPIQRYIFLEALAPRWELALKEKKASRLGQTCGDTCVPPNDNDVVPPTFHTSTIFVSRATIPEQLHRRENSLKHRAKVWQHCGNPTSSRLKQNILWELAQTKKKASSLQLRYTIWTTNPSVAIDTSHLCAPLTSVARIAARAPNTVDKNITM